MSRRYKWPGAIALACSTFTAVCAHAQEGGWRKFGASPDNQATAPPVPANTPSQLILPAGTWITIRVNQPLSSDYNQPGDAFTATLAQPLVVNGFVIARRGQTVEGRVAEAQKAGRAKGTSRLGLELMEIGLVDGQQLPVRTQLIEYHAGTSKGRDATAIATTTGIGAAIGAAADGGFGAGIGAAAGAVASTIGVLVTRGRPTEVDPETPLTFRTLEPLAISTERSEQSFQTVRQDDYQPRLAQRRSVQQPPPPVYYGGWPGWYGPGWGPGWYGPSFFVYSGPRFYGRGYWGGRYWGHRGWRRW